MADPSVPPEAPPVGPGIHIAPPPAPREPRAVYATFILENTADARVTQAFCLTTPADRPTSYCGFEITATVPEAPQGVSVALGVVLLAGLAWSKRRRHRRSS